MVLVTETRLPEFVLDCKICIIDLFCFVMNTYLSHEEENAFIFLKKYFFLSSILFLSYENQLWITLFTRKMSKILVGVISRPLSFPVCLPIIHVTLPSSLSLHCWSNYIQGDFSLFCLSLNLSPSPVHFDAWCVRPSAVCRISNKALMHLNSPFQKVSFLIFLFVLNPHLMEMILLFNLISILILPLKWLLNALFLIVIEPIGSQLLAISPFALISCFRTFFHCFLLHHFYVSLFNKINCIHLFINYHKSIQDLQPNYFNSHQIACINHMRSILNKAFGLDRQNHEAYELDTINSPAIATLGFRVALISSPFDFLLMITFSHL